MELKFVAPPEATRGGGPRKSREIAEALRARPGEWALVAEGVGPSIAHNIKHGSVSVYQPAGSFEAVSRKGKNGRSDIYARYVGGASK